MEVIFHILRTQKRQSSFCTLSLYLKQTQFNCAFILLITSYRVCVCVCVCTLPMLSSIFLSFSLVYFNYFFEVLAIKIAPTIFLHFLDFIYILNLQCRIIFCSWADTMSTPYIFSILYIYHFFMSIFFSYFTFVFHKIMQYNNCV